MADDILIRLCDKLLLEMVTYEKALGQLKVLGMYHILVYIV